MLKLNVINKTPVEMETKKQTKFFALETWL